MKMNYSFATTLEEVLWNKDNNTWGTYSLNLFLAAAEAIKNFALTEKPRDPFYLLAFLITTSLSTVTYFSS